MGDLFNPNLLDLRPRFLPLSTPPPHKKCTSKPPCPLNLSSPTEIAVNDGSYYAIFDTIRIYDTTSNSYLIQLLLLRYWYMENFKGSKDPRGQFV